MKLFASLIALLLTCSLSYAQQSSFTEPAGTISYSMNMSVYEQSIHKTDRAAGPVLATYDFPKTTRVKRGQVIRYVGIGMTFGGLALTGIGAIVTATGKTSYTASSGGGSSSTPDDGHVVGYTFLGVGSAITITGIILWAKGAHQLKGSSSKKRSAMNFDMNGTVGKLSYKF